MSLTAQQRKDYADMLASGVPEDVIEEFDARAAKYIAEWERGITGHIQKLSRRK